MRLHNTITWTLIKSRKNVKVKKKTNAQRQLVTKDRKKNQPKETVICAPKKTNVACINCHMLHRYCTQFQWFHRHLVKYTCQTKRNNLNRHVYRSCCSSHFLLRSFALYFCFIFQIKCANGYDAEKIYSFFSLCSSYLFLFCFSSYLRICVRA